MIPGPSLSGRGWPVRFPRTRRDHGTSSLTPPSERHQDAYFTFLTATHLYQETTPEQLLFDSASLSIYWLIPIVDHSFRSFAHIQL